MARIRSVHPGLASDEAFMSMSMAAKAAWSLLWTECDDAGVFEWKPIVLKARIFPADNVDFTAVLAEYEALNCVRRVELEGKAYGVVRNFGKFQRPKNPSYRFPDGARDPEFTSVRVGGGDNPPPALPQPTPRAPEIPPQMKEEGGRKGEEEIEDKPLSPARLAERDLKAAARAAFHDWYSAYPKHTEPVEAEKVYVRVVASRKATIEQLLAGARSYAAQVSRDNTEKRFIKAPPVWLNKGCWADEEIPPPRTQPNVTPFRGTHDASRSTTAEARRQLARALDDEAADAARWSGDLLQIGSPEGSYDPDGLLPQGRGCGSGNLYRLGG